MLSETIALITLAFASLLATHRAARPTPTPTETPKPRATDTPIPTSTPAPRMVTVQNGEHCFPANPTMSPTRAEITQLVTNFFDQVLRR